MQVQTTQSFDVTSLPYADTYRLLCGSIIPRPIAWVSSIDAHGIRNVAPFSFFNAVCSNPPVLSFCAAIRAEKNGLRPTKDTLENIRATGEFVVNIVSDETAEAMNLTAAQLLPDEDEFLHAGLTAVASEVVRPPRVGEAKIQMECSLRQIIEVSREVNGASMVLGNILRIHVSEAVLEPNFHISAEKLRAVGRLAGNAYVHTGEMFEMPRPR